MQGPNLDVLFHFPTGGNFYAGDPLLWGTAIVIFPALTGEKTGSPQLLGRVIHRSRSVDLHSRSHRALRQATELGPQSAPA